MRPGHNLFWINAANKMGYYRYDTDCPPFGDERAVNILQLRRKAPDFRVYMDLWARPAACDAAAGNPEAKAVREVFAQLKAGQEVQRMVLQKAALALFKLGPVNFLQAMRDFEAPFRQVLTPDYGSLLDKIDLSVPRYDELLFHACSPDLYLWTPVKMSEPRRLLVCFCTRTGTLNMPLPLAHLALTRLGVGILYVRHNARHLAIEGLMGMGVDASAELIKSIARHFGFTKLYGTGTSFGGYAACLYGARLGFERVLSFSGSAAVEYPGNELWTVTKPYDLSRIMSVLSVSDPLNQKLKADYEANGFITPQALMQTNTHGTFTAALLEGKLQEQFSWLLSGS